MKKKIMISLSALIGLVFIAFLLNYCFQPFALNLARHRTEIQRIEIFDGSVSARHVEKFDISVKSDGTISCAVTYQGNNGIKNVSYLEIKKVQFTLTQSQFDNLVQQAQEYHLTRWHSFPETPRAGGSSFYVRYTLSSHKVFDFSTSNRILGDIGGYHNAVLPYLESLARAHLDVK